MKFLNMHRFFTCIIFLTSFLGIQAQNLSLNVIEDSLRVRMDRIYSDLSISERVIANAQIVEILKANLSRMDIFDYPFDSLKHIGKIKSNDGKVRIFTWNFPLLDGNQKYYGFIVVKQKNLLRVTELNDSRSNIDNPIKDILLPNKWMGALYYSIFSISSKGESRYILLGFDFNTLFSSKKVIDVLSVAKSGEVSFGADVFCVGETTLRRVVFEFSSRATMMLRYIPESQTIVFDHLSPSRPDYANNFQFYGPDFSYDGFKLEKGKWIYVRNLDLRNPRREPVKPKESDEKFVDPGFLYKSKGGLPMVIKNSENAKK